MNLIKPSRKGISIYPVNTEIFTKEDDISFYLLGAYMTDGNIRDKKHHLSFSISSKDQDWIENIKNLIAPTKPLYFDKRSNCVHFQTSHTESMNWLISYGCTARKTKTITIEKEIPPQYYTDFVRGVLDGDGSISTCQYIAKRPNNRQYTYTKTTVYICGASGKFLEQIKEMIPIEIKCNIIKFRPKECFINSHKVIPTCDMYRLCFNDGYAKKLLQWLYYPDHKISLNRKKEKAYSILESSPGRI